jgi:hypothetical protein
VITVEVIGGHVQDRCACGQGRTRWEVTDRNGSRRECNGCFMRRLQALYTVATGYSVRGASGLPEERA